MAPSLSVTDADNRACLETNIVNATVELSPFPDGSDEKLEIVVSTAASTIAACCPLMNCV